MTKEPAVPFSAPRPAIQAIRPARKPRPKPSFRGKPIGHGSGRAEHSLKPHVEARRK